MTERTLMAYTADLVEAVTAMRVAQRRYFRTRSQADLVASKRLEAQVDALLREPQKIAETRRISDALLPFDAP